MRIDLTNRLNVVERPSLIINGKDYIVDNTAKAIVKMAELEKKGEVGFESLAIVLGDEAYNEILDSGIDFNGLKVIMAYAFGLARGESEEKIEEMLNKAPSAI